MSDIRGSQKLTLAHGSFDLKRLRILMQAQIRHLDHSLSNLILISSVILSSLINVKTSLSHLIYFYM